MKDGRHYHSPYNVIAAVSGDSNGRYNGLILKFNLDRPFETEYPSLTLSFLVVIIIDKFPDQSLHIRTWDQII